MSDAPAVLREGEDYYIEGGSLVFTAAYHRRRGSCCGSGCCHCPYPESKGESDGESKGELEERPPEQFS